MGIAAALLSQASLQSLPAADDPAPASPQYGEAPPPPPPAPPGDAAPMSALDTLLAPIALYPDPLIALLLPASTFPDQVSAASAFLVQYADPTQIDGQPWDPSVKALAHYPTVVTWMAQNMDWTEALGSAFQSSPSDVMESIQGLRSRAWASGALTSTPQQQVYSEDGAIEIIPAQPDVLFIPVYDPDVVYSNVSYDGYGGPFINFGSPCAAGAWLTFGFDWSGHFVWVAGPQAWRGPSGWHRPAFAGSHAPQGARPWQAPANTLRGPSRGPDRRGSAVPLPRPMAGAPNPPPAHFRNANPSTAPQRGDGSSAGRMPPTRSDEPPVSREGQSPGNNSRTNDAETRRDGPGGARPAPPEATAPSAGSPAAGRESPPPAHNSASHTAPAETPHTAAPGTDDPKGRDPGR
jgi:Protein of unknown function (DUF3300)